MRQMVVSWRCAACFSVSLLPGLAAHCLSTYRQCRGRPSGPHPRVCPPVAQAGPKRPHPTARSARPRLHVAPPRARPLVRSCSHVAPQWRQPPRGSAPTTPRLCGSHAIHRQRSCRPVQSAPGHRQFPNPGVFAPSGWVTVRSRYKRQLIQLKMSKKWPTWSGMEDSRPIFSCKRFSYNENALYHNLTPNTATEHGVSRRPAGGRRAWRAADRCCAAHARARLELDARPRSGRRRHDGSGGGGGAPPDQPRRL